MREIKFRVWNQELNEMYEIKKMNYFGSVGIVDNLACGETAIWLAYTGLKDANGVEIFEGDILGFCDFDSLRTGGNTSDKMHTAVVKFSEGSWVVEDGGYCDYLYQVIANDSELEIIGNIYENKELLEVAE